VPTTKSRAGDMTGRVRDQQAQALKAELDARAEEIGLATANHQAEILNEVTDFTQPVPVVIPDNSPVDFTADDIDPDAPVLDAVPTTKNVRVTQHELEDELEEVELEEVIAWKVIYMFEELENATIGAGNTRTYKVGQKYKVPAHVADHLIEKGYARLV
jgi:hypothetical protein